VTNFLANAERILETAASADGVELESGNFSILIGRDGAMRMVMTGKGQPQPMHMDFDFISKYLGANCGDIK